MLLQAVTLTVRLCLSPSCRQVTSFPFHSLYLSLTTYCALGPGEELSEGGTQSLVFGVVKCA